MAELTKEAQIIQFLASGQAGGMPDRAIAEQFKCNPGTVARARKKHAAGSVGGLLRTVRLTDLVCDPRVQMRTETDAEAIQRYQEAAEDSQTLPPLVAFDVDGVGLVLAAGFHRHAAYLLAGFEDCVVEVRHGTFDDAILYAVGDNAAHGLPRTKDTLIRSITAYRDWFKRTYDGQEPSVNAVKAACKVGSWEFTKAVLEGFDNSRDLRKARAKARAESDPDPVDPDDDEAVGADKDGDQGEPAAPREPREPRAAPADTPAGLSDAEWLDSLPIRGKIESDQFDREALIYRQVAPEIQGLRAVASELLPEDRRMDGPLEKILRALVEAKHPRDWGFCLACKGTGKVGKSTCVCGGGYNVK